MNEDIIQMGIDALSQEIKKSPQDARLYKERGRLQMMLGHQAEAMRDLRLAIELDPTIVEGVEGEFHL